MIRIHQLQFRYPQSDFVLSIPELRVLETESLAFIGPSGSGKTTLLQLIAGIRLPESGTVEVLGKEPSRLSEYERRSMRVRQIGLVFQDFALLDYLSVRDNILLPGRIHPDLSITDEMKNRADGLARELGLQDKLNRSVMKLSQGEKQRVAVCRALVTRPKLVLADEPTGNLDPTNKGVVLDTLFRCVQSVGATLIVVTHDHDLLSRFDRVIDFKQFYAMASTGAGA